MVALSDHQSIVAPTKNLAWL